MSDDEQGCLTRCHLQKRNSALSPLTVFAVSSKKRDTHCTLTQVSTADTVPDILKVLRLFFKFVLSSEEKEQSPESEPKENAPTFLC
mgnify:CR=1 FL=1